MRLSKITKKVDDLDSNLGSYFYKLHLLIFIISCISLSAVNFSSNNRLRSSANFSNNSRALTVGLTTPRIRFKKFNQKYRDSNPLRSERQKISSMIIFGPRNIFLLLFFHKTCKNSMISYRSYSINCVRILIKNSNIF